DVVVAARDQFGNISKSINGPITVALANNPLGATLNGTLTATAANGVATLAGLSLNKVGTGITLQVSSGALSGTVSKPITIIAGATTQLAVTVQPPGTVVAGATFSVTVRAQDAQGNVITSFNSPVILSVGTNPGGLGILGGTVTSIAVTDGGSGYSSASPPNVSIDGGGGSGATAIAVVNDTTGAISSIMLLTGGSGYTS